jgi:hypothetical protein
MQPRRQIVGGGGHQRESGRQRAQGGQSLQRINLYDEADSTHLSQRWQVRLDPRARSRVIAR